MRTTINSGHYELNQWQTPEYADSWLTDEIRQRSYRPAREKLVSLLPFPPEAIIRVLDIGAGNGALSLEVLAAYPKAQLVCHDFSETMLDRARQRLAQFSKQIVFVKGDLRDPAWTQAIEGTFDAVVSSMAIHNLAEPNQGVPERIAEVYGEVFGLLKPGGCFLNYEHVSAPGPVVQRIYRQQREQQFPEWKSGRSEGLPEQVRSGFPSARTLFTQMEGLKQAGFDEIDCLWKDRRDAIIGGFKH